MAEDKFLYLTALQFPHTEEEGGEHPFSSTRGKKLKEQMAKVLEEPGIRAVLKMADRL